ncbi:hybrid sensor histidine kinase/response regulator [Rheinheimera salexigens]|uniref:hybrid sensor histidine kinase/response regulator n=1 Tax=Rheinheimera salexigens TaxID=1628148 RepID=UPI000B0D7D6A|nr:hybrid sensor histidine kinase/response regulator [Rheinheimera salexigens]
MKFRSCITRWLTVYLLLLVSVLNLANSAELAGAPLLSNFKPKDYNGGTQNWAIAQDQHGLLYVGNNVGVMQYDGAQWRMIQTGNKSVARSLALAVDGNIYVGAKGDIGYLDQQNDSRYVSLIDRIPAEYRDFQDVRQTFAAAEGVYFVSRNYIFRVSYDHATDNQVKVWRTNSRFLKAFWLDDRLIVREQDTGLVELVNNNFQLVAGSERFASTSVYVLLRYDDTRLLVGSRTKGLYLMDANGSQPWQTDINSVLMTDVLYTGYSLNSGDFVLGTSQSGAYILTPEGKLKHHLDKSVGVVDQNVRAIYQDHQQGLWLALDHGLSRIDLSSAISYFDDNNGLRGNVLALHKHNNVLYVGTSLGLFYQDNGKHFTLISAIQKQTWDFMEFGPLLLVANSRGVYSLVQQQLQLIRPSEQASKTLYQSKANPDRLYIGLQDGLASMRYDNGNWHDEGQVPGVKGNINSILELDNGELWLGSLAHGVYQLIIPQQWQGGNSVPLALKRFAKTAGLPSANRNAVSVFNQQLLIATVAGFYRFDRIKEQFYLDQKLAAAFSQPQPWVRLPQEDIAGNLWLLTWDNTDGSRRAGALLADNSGQYRWQAAALEPLRDIPFDTLMIDQANTIWFGGAEGVFRFASEEHQTITTKAPLIRQLRQIGDANVLFSGTAMSTQQELALAPNVNSLRFVYASPNYSHLFTPQFQVKLEGYDKDWSEFSTELYRDYTNLPSGDYQFMLRSRDNQNELYLSQPLQFSITKAWYLTSYALFSYLLLFALSLYLILKGYYYSLQKDKEKLTLQIQQHSADMQLTMKELQQAKLHAEAASVAKGEFLANMSHELRTPLNAVLGFAELAQECNDPIKRNSYLQKIQASGKVLLSVISDILDFSKVEADKLQLESLPFSLVDTVEQVSDIFSNQLQHKPLKFSKHIDSNIPTLVAGDALRLSQILINLLSNAIKFTERGEITLSITQSQQQHSGQTLINFSVADTGIGIALEQQKDLFTAFNQADSSISRKYGGTGLGLAISHRLVKLMGGNLQLSSQKGVGSRFYFSLLFNQVPPQAAGSNFTATIAATGSATSKSSEATAVTLANQSTTAQQEPKRLTPAQHTVLLVEDNYFNQVLVQIVLQKLGYQILTANNGEQALTMAQQQPVSLVLMDIEMPGLNGYETTEQLRQLANYANTPIIAMTAHCSEDIIKQCYSSNMDDVLSKPFSHAELMQKLERWLS